MYNSAYDEKATVIRAKQYSLRSKSVRNVLGHILDRITQSIAVYMLWEREVLLAT